LFRNEHISPYIVLHKQSLVLYLILYLYIMYIYMEYIVNYNEYVKYFILHSCIYDHFHIYSITTLTKPIACDVKHQYWHHLYVLCKLCHFSGLFYLTRYIPCYIAWIYWFFNIFETMLLVWKSTTNN
jgi:hypothetical protein